MTSRERVIAAFERRKADRLPTDLRCTPEALDALKKHLKLDSEIGVLDALDIDMRTVYLPFIGPKERSTETLGGAGKDFWGIEMKAAVNEFNTYFDFSKHPLADAKTVRDVEDYDWPSLDWWDYGAIPGLIREHNRKGERAVMFFAGGAFETPWYLRGFQQFLTDLYDNPDIVYAICSRVADYYRQRALRVLEAAGGRIDIIGSGGDIGGQNGMLLNPALWRSRIKPHTASLIAPFKKMGLKTYYHSCGSLVPVIGDLIEVGLDMLEPIQVTAAGMTPEELFPMFGDRLSFHGAIDEVELLPHATPEGVYRETQRIMSILGRNGGFVVTSSHAVQGDTSAENIVAMIQAAKDFRFR